MKRERQAGRQTDRQTDRQAGRQADRQIGRQAETEKEKTQHVENVIYRHKREVLNVKAHTKKEEEKSHTCIYNGTYPTPYTKSRTIHKEP